MDQIWEPEEVRSPKCTSVTPHCGNSLVVYKMNKMDYIRGTVDKTLFTLEKKNEMMMVQIYVDDIIFGGTSEKLVENFVKSMTKEFKMSMVGELKYFLGL
ncbi:unnamed protein product [Microthlaspi erraticum]|uniref:Reverse transcriptase Ty1/copia-type domain-containing protein n=1 Tax=Microthlaspi erraticum TaxID=1685480 RepID=A0A6D2L2U8_9BRAS|nr:unnamed protein product [Microthlaspi erraticum]